MQIGGFNTTFSQAKFNFFRSNNQTGGGGAGNGLFSDAGAMNMYIDNNLFTGHTPAASINFAATAGTQRKDPPYLLAVETILSKLN